MAFTEQEINEFKTEALDLLEEAEKSLLALDEGAEFSSHYDGIFRTFHSLKGAAGMMEMTLLQSHMHQLENILVGFKAGGIIPKEYVDLFLRGSDTARLILSGQDITFDFTPKKQNDSTVSLIPKIEVSPHNGISEATLSEFILECEEISERVAEGFSLFEKNEQSPDTIDSIYRDIHSLKGAAALFGFNQMGDLAHAMESILEPVRADKIVPSRILIDCLFQCMNLIDRMVVKVRKKEKFGFEKEIQLLVQCLKNIPSTITRPQTKSVIVKETPIVSDSEKESAQTIRVSVGLLDRLMALMGEMVLVRNQVLQYSSRNDDLEFSNLSQRLNVITSEVQGEMMKTRMQPIGNVINKFHRVVRDLSKDLNKEIELHVIGAETELDKTLLEAVKDPLTHIIRNSCDHGIEQPLERKSFGKSDKGEVTVKSFHEGGQVVIEVKDDGKGLDKEKLLAKGLEKNLITPEKASAMSEREIFNLIFAPGFSTAAQVTNVSGRGVGMDVVKNNLDRMGGTVEIESVHKKGTTIRLKIPLTLAIVPAMIVRVNESFYAIPQVKLVELVRVEADSVENPVEFLQGKPVFRLRGNLLPLVDLKEVLQFGGTEQPRNTFNIVVLNADTQSFGLIVDEIQDTADIVVKPLSLFLKSLNVYSGATVLGDGTVALILDIQGIAALQSLQNDRKTDHLRQESKQIEENFRKQEMQEFLLFKLSTPTKYALFLGYVHRLEEFNRNKIEVSGAQRIVRYRGSVLPLLSLNEFLGYPEHSSSEVISVVVIKKGDHFVGIEVNDIFDVLATDSYLDHSFSDRSGILGNLITNDEVIVVVDPHPVITSFFLKSDVASKIKAIANPSRESLEEKMSDLTRKSIVSTTCKRIDETKVLFIEDTSFFRKHVSSVLKTAGCEVVTANDGEQALHVLEKSETKDFDLIVSDIEMPKISGLQFAQIIRGNPKWKHIPLIALTTRSESKSIEMGKKAGFDIYLEKMNPAELLGAIQSLISKLGRAG